MGAPAIYTEQMPFVGTETQRAVVEALAKRRKISMAQVIRDSLDVAFNLTNGEYPQGDPRWDNPDAEVPIA